MHEAMKHSSRISN